ncbi:hypothetical protein P7K49_003744, partial [Saguinus oedipus]
LDRVHNGQTATAPRPPPRGWRRPRCSFPGMPPGGDLIRPGAKARPPLEGAALSSRATRLGSRGGRTQEAGGGCSLPLPGFSGYSFRLGAGSTGWRLRITAPRLCPLLP